MVSMKIKNIVAVLIVGFILASCSPVAKVIPTETVILTFTPTVTVTALPTVTSTPDYTPTPTTIPEVWTDSVQEIDGGGWKITGIIFDPNNIVAFPAEYESGIKESPYYGKDIVPSPHYGEQGKGETLISWMARVKLPTGQEVLTGIMYWQRDQVSPTKGLWEGNKLYLGNIGISYSTQPTAMGALTSINNRMTQGDYSSSVDILYETNIPAGIKADILAPIIIALTPPIEFWETGNVNLLPKINDEPFLLATELVFNKNK